MTALVSFGAFLALCVVACKVATRMGEAGDELRRRSRPRAPDDEAAEVAGVVFETYTGTPPKPLTAKQLANLKDRRARLDARESYRERPFLN